MFRTSPLYGLLGVVGILLACAAASQTIPSSPLAGDWICTTKNGDSLCIREDGSFDLTRTMLAMIGDVRALRNVGDRVERPADGVLLEVIEAEYTPDRSYIRLKMSMSRPDRSVEVTFAQFEARLEPGDQIAVRAGPLASENSAHDSIATVTYAKQVKPETTTQPAREAAPTSLPTESRLKWAGLGARTFAGRNWFAELDVESVSEGPVVAKLLRPRRQQDAQRFLVVRVHATERTYFDNSVVGSAPDAVMSQCSVLVIGIPELAPYKRPTPERTCELADAVRVSTRAVLRSLRPKSCVLETRGLGTQVGHCLWQSDNTDFAGWFCGDPDPPKWYATLSISDPKRPILVEFIPQQGERGLARVREVSQLYQDHGFRGGQYCMLHGFVPNPGQEIIRLLGAATNAAKPE